MNNSRFNNAEVAVGSELTVLYAPPQLVDGVALESALVIGMVIANTTSEDRAVTIMVFDGETPLRKLLNNGPIAPGGSLNWPSKIVLKYGQSLCAAGDTVGCDAFLSLMENT